MPTILFLNDTSDYDNWGSIAGAECLKEEFQRAIPGLKIRSVPSRWTTAQYWQVPGWIGGGVSSSRPRVIGKFYKPSTIQPVIADEFDLVAEEWLAGRGTAPVKSVLTNLEGVDAVVFHAEGTTYRNNISAMRCLFTLWFASTKLGIPGIFMNGSLSLTNVDPRLPPVVRKVFPRLSFVSVREPCSLRNAQEFVPEVQVELIPDSVFLLAQAGRPRAALPVDIERAIGSRPYFCFSSSMLLSILPRYLRFGAESSPLVALIRELQKVGLAAVFMARDGMDQELIRAIARATGSPVFGPKHTYHEVAALLSGAAFLVSGRFHHIILATIVGCPAIPLRTTSHKVDGLCELLEGALGNTFDPTDLWPAIPLVVARAEELLSDLTIRDRLRDLAQGLGTRATRYGDVVRDVLSG